MPFNISYFNILKTAFLFHNLDSWTPNCERYIKPTFNKKGSTWSFVENLPRWEIRIGIIIWGNSEYSSSFLCQNKPQKDQKCSGQKFIKPLHILTNFWMIFVFGNSLILTGWFEKSGLFQKLFFYWNVKGSKKNWHKMAFMKYLWTTWQTENDELPFSIDKLNFRLVIKLCSGFCINLWFRPTGINVLFPLSSENSFWW